MAEAADAFGYDMVGIADTPGIAMDPWVATTLLASDTRRARVAVCVTNLVTRHPAVAAASIASVDLLAPGRTVLGVGVGHSGTRNLGAPSLPAGELAEGVAFIKELLRGRPAAYRGGTAHLPWVKRPSPVFLAASHPRSLRAAGAHADGVFINYGLAADNVADSESAVARAAREARPESRRRRDLADRVSRLQRRRRRVTPQDRRDPRVRVGATSWAAAISPAAACRRAPRGAAGAAPPLQPAARARPTPRSSRSSACSTISAVAWRYAARPKNAWRRCARPGAGRAGRSGDLHGRSSAKAPADGRDGDRPRRLRASLARGGVPGAPTRDGGRPQLPAAAAAGTGTSQLDRLASHHLSDLAHSCSLGTASRFDA